MRLSFLSGLLVVALTGCAIGHPLVGIDAGGESGGDSDLLLLALLAAGLGGGTGGATAGDAGGDGSTSTTTTVLRFLYSGNGAGNSIGMFTVNDSTGLLTANTPASIAAGSDPWYPTAHPDGTYLYAPQRSGGSISQYRIDTDTGLLGALSPATVATSSADPLTMIVHPNGRYAYAGFIGNDGIDMFLVAADGTLSANSPANLSGCDTANEFVFHPNGNYLYVLCSNSIRRHSINGDGTLTFLGSNGAGGSQANGLAITADGAYMYATSQGASNIRAFSVDSATGNLANLGNVATDTWANEVVVDPTGSYAFVNCWDSGALTVRQYVIAPGAGTLSDNSPNSIPTGGSQPLGMTIGPLGRYVYVANTAGNSINQYSLDSATGLLTSNGLLGVPNGPRGMVPVSYQVTQ